MTTTTTTIKKKVTVEENTQEVSVRREAAGHEVTVEAPRLAQNSHPERQPLNDQAGNDLQNHTKYALVTSHPEETILSAKDS